MEKRIEGLQRRYHPAMRRRLASIVALGTVALVVAHDPRKRAPIYRAIGRRVHDTVPFIPLFRRRRVSVFNDDLRGYDPAPVAAPWWNTYAWSI